MVIRMNLEIKKAFDDDGYVRCNQFTPVDEIQGHLDRVLRQVVKQMPAEHVFYEDKDDSSTLKQLQLLNRHDSFFSVLASQGVFFDLAQFLLGEPVTCQNIQYFNKPPQIGAATPAHQDSYYFKLEPPQALTMWFALDSVDHENGCVRYLPGSHRQGMRSHQSTGTLGFSQGIVDYPGPGDAESEVAMPAQPGDLLVHHALTIHRADANLSASRQRRAIGLIFYGASAQVDLNSWERYQSHLKDELIRNNKI